MELPRSLALTEIGPGEAWITERPLVPTQVKVEVLRRLAAAGLDEVVVTAFVEARDGAEAPHQVADGATLLERLAMERPAGRDGGPPPRWTVRVDGPAAARRALALDHRPGGLVVTAPVTDSWARRVLGREPEAAREAVAGVLAEVLSEVPGTGSAGAQTPGKPGGSEAPGTESRGPVGGPSEVPGTTSSEVPGTASGTRTVPVTVVLAPAFGCPFEGVVEPGLVVEAAGRWLAAGASCITLADPPGLGAPPPVEALVSALVEGLGVGGVDDPRGDRLAVRPGDARGLGLACALAALLGGARRLEGSAGGAGLAPSEPGAPLATATEDLVHLAEACGVATGVDFVTLRRAGRRLLEVLARELPSRSLHVEPRHRVLARLEGSGPAGSRRRSASP